MRVQFCPPIKLPVHVWCWRAVDPLLTQLQICRRVTSENQIHCNLSNIRNIHHQFIHDIIYLVSYGTPKAASSIV